MLKRLRFLGYSVVLALSLYMYFLSAQRPPPEVDQPQKVTHSDPFPARASLAIRRDTLTGLFEQAPFDLSFDFVPLEDGRSRVIGRSRDGRTTLELIGPPEGVTSANLMAALPAENPLVRLRNVNAISLLVDSALADWHGASDWVGENIDGVFAGQSARTQATDKTVTMSRAPGTETMVVTVLGAPL